MPDEPGSYVSGVPVRISEAFRPPRKVTLPSSCPHAVDAELLTEEYDVTVETAAISWIEDYHQRKEESANKRQENVKIYRQRKIQRKAQLEEEIKQKEEEDEKRRQKELEEEEERRRLARIEEEKLEIEKERAELARLSEEMLEKEKLEFMRLKNEKLEKERAEKEKVLKEKAEQERMEQINMARLTKESVREKISCVIDTPNANDDNSVADPQLASTSSNLASQAQRTIPEVGGNSTLINFEDFEADRNDPFDRATLQSINDMEELAQVLQSTSVSSQQCSSQTQNLFYPDTHKSGSPVKSSVAIIPGMTAFSNFSQFANNSFYPRGQVQFPPDTSMNIYPSNQFSSSDNAGLSNAPPNVDPSNASSHIGSSNARLDAGSNASSSQKMNQFPPSNGTTTNVYSNILFHSPWHQQPHFDEPGLSNSSQASLVTNPSSITSSSNSILHNPYNSYGYGLPASSSLDHPRPSSRTPSSTNYYGSGPTVPTFSSPTSPSNNYRGFSSAASNINTSHGSNLSNNYGQYQIPGNNIAFVQCNVLNSHPINPTSSVSSYQHINSYSMPPRLPTPASYMVTTTHNLVPLTTTTTTRTTSNTTVETRNPAVETRNPSVDTRNPTVYPSNTGSSSSASSISESNSGFVQSPLELPDPFSELDSEVQSLVCSVAEMGFPRARVARAVQRLGTQHKKLIEVLLELQRLEEEGQEAGRAEVAFYAHLGDLHKTKQHLDTCKQY
ncbi:hypothetical protein HAZT_HAZT007084 [Hyalella azteca]|uniref:UBA domain-containing protein n=1 Tax=Hyalella azteca TaxID=294128 RepID=A0A6A0GTY6_HYAAZ|nr:hypothetical protein HAZT_HAZT007084 [Hyalella azteca]